jgi:hypothetical protein
MEFMMKRACPADELLADYLEGRLSEKKASDIERHLSSCDICLEELAVANSLLLGGHLTELESVPAEVTESAVHLICSQDWLVFKFLPERIERSLKELPTKIFDLLNHKSWGELQPQPVRGPKRKVGKDFVLLKKTFQDIDTEIEIEKIGDNMARIRVRILADDAVSQIIRVTLKKEDREIASYLAERSFVLFDDIPFDHYSLTFARDGSMLGIYHFEIKETQSGRK